MHAEIQKLQTRLHFRFQTKTLPALPHQSVPTKGVSLIKQRTWRRGDQQKMQNDTRKQLAGPVLKALQGRFWACLIGSTFYKRYLSSDQ